MLVLLVLLAVGASSRAFPFTDTLQEEATVTSPLQDVSEIPSFPDDFNRSNDTDLDNNSTLLSINGTDSSVDDIVKTVRDHTEGPLGTGSDKERRLEAIRAAILNSTGRSEKSSGGTTPANPHREMIEKLFKIWPWSSTEGFTEKVQSFYPICSPHKPGPAAAAAAVTVGDTQPQQQPVPPPPPPKSPPPGDNEERESMNLFLFFNLSYPTPLEGSVLNIVAARLKLFKFSQDNQSSSNAVAPCATRHAVDPAMALEAVAMAAANVPQPSLGLPAAVVPTEAYVDDDRRIRVSVYFNARRKNRMRRKLLDTKMVPVVGDEWVDLNVRAAARIWRNASKNLGLVVAVEDEEGKPLVASRFFHDMNCSKEASTSRPIPSFLLDAARERHQNASLLYNTNLFPVIDLCTMDLPKPEKKPATEQAPPPYLDHQAKHVQLGENGQATSVVLVPFHKLSDLHAVKKPSHHHEAAAVTAVAAAPVEDEEEEEALDGGKHQSEVRPSLASPPEQVLEDSPLLEELQFEQVSPHPHRHHRNQHRAHSHEDFSRHHEESAESSPEDEATSAEDEFRRVPHHAAAHRNHKFHRHHFGSQDWSGEVSHRMIVLPAADLLALSEKFEQQQQQQEQEQREQEQEQQQQQQQREQQQHHHHHHQHRAHHEDR